MFDRLAHRIRKKRASAIRAALCAAACAAACLWMACPAWPQQKLDDLTGRSLEDLMNVEVTSVSKTEQKLSRTAAAVFVITQEDIRQSGATNIPDLLRMAPGVDVAQINANTWAISARGLNGEFSNELLVMVDGRTVYTPTFGGVYWDVLDMPLEDIERIEVTRGPGGSLWGGNAVNGVIDIITKKAGETQGGMVVAGGGTLDQGFATTQYGGTLGSKADYRVYSKYFNQDHFPDLAGQSAHDGWHMLRGGFRIDSTVSPKDTFMFRGDLYSGEEGEPTAILPSVTSPATVPAVLQVDLSGGFIQSVWNHSYSTQSDSTLQVSFDRYQRNDLLREGRGTLNIDFQDHLARNRNEIVWGLGYRYSTSASNGGLTASLIPNALRIQVFSMFVQDEIALVPDRLYVTLGAKAEHNDYTGFVFLPTARVTWAESGRNMFWAAISRAERTPADSDNYLRANFGSYPGPDGTPVLIALVGNRHFENEGLTAYEAGYRTTMFEHLSIDATAFYNAYDHQQTEEPAASFPESTPLPAHIVMPITYENLMHGETHGIEIAANWKPVSRWTLSPGYAFEEIHMHTLAASQDTTSAADDEGSNPPHSAQLRSHLELERGFAWDASGYFVDRLKSVGIPSYTRVDTQLTWQWNERLSFSLVGQNLLRDHHIEFIDPAGAETSSLIKRSAYAKVSWRFGR